MKISLSLLCVLFILNSSGCRTVVAANRVEVDFDHVTALAQELARKPFDEARRKVPAHLSALGYDQYREIRFRPENALWADAALPFRVEFFHPGYLFKETVVLREFTATHEQRIPFVPDFFDYGTSTEVADRVDASLDYAGFRVRYPINQRGVYDELLVFLGASYFRVVGRGQVYGLSARGLAIDTGAAGPESFPAFRAFWLGKPAADAKSLKIYALLDGAKVAGAYEFTVTPGAPTRVAVRARILLRTAVETLGLAPMSSMFWYGENTMRPPPDWRPEVHDSDGLAIWTDAGEFLWRPLRNPARTRREPFPGTALRGFGLFQRDRRFEAYEDNEAEYHRRPSFWVEPGEGMEEGRVQLLEIATQDEYADNIAIFWEPVKPPAPGELFSFAYTLTAGMAPAPETPTVVATRMGESQAVAGALEFVVDFSGDPLSTLAEVEPVGVALEVEGGTVLFQQVQKIDFEQRWRLHLRVRPDAPATALHLRAQLRLNEQAISETWLYQWNP